MKENITISALLIFYLIVSWLIHLSFFRAKNISVILLICAGYLLFTFFLFVMLIELHSYLRQHKIYFEFGHAEESLVELLFLWYAIAFINIAIMIVRKNNNFLSK
jgi:hypothetical protein